jgi:hypothetical protein
LQAGAQVVSQPSTPKGLLSCSLSTVANGIAFLLN